MASSPPMWMIGAGEIAASCAIASRQNASARSLAGSFRLVHNRSVWVELKTSMGIARVVQDRDGLYCPRPHAGSGRVDRRRQQLPKAHEAVEQAMCLRGDDLHARTRHPEGVALGRGDRVPLWDAGH